MPKGNALPSVIADALTILAGAILTITSAIYIIDTIYLRNVWKEIFVLSIYSIAVGFLAVIISIGLIYFVLRQFPALTSLFSGLIIFVAVVAAIGAIILLIGRSSLRRKSEDNLNKLLSNYSDSNVTLSSEPILGRIQQSFKCCGVIRPADWSNKTFDGLSTPDSCCRQQVLGCGKGQLVEQNKIYKIGCLDRISDNLNRKYLILIGMNFIVTLLGVFSAIAGFVYQRSIKQQYQLM